METGVVEYFPYWPRRLSKKLGGISDSPHCRHCVSAQAEVHCLWASRGLSRWVVTLHSFDAYLAVNPGFADTAHTLGRSRSNAHGNPASVTAPLLSLEPL